ncbi:hypothetical protein ACEZCY_10170 [Streptacidiphilus sp. N1-12]|uniref:Uncharacterized protein n=2 Tax=Streptacidiphilus alkalitolerans TaxID=3342712 RepID=A0ABV6WC26_9ACTN
MGIESDQVVYDYLSRVGDLAQATSLTAAERARLVSGLRETIDTRRGASAGTTTGSVRGEATAVQKILSGIGTPDEVVRQAVSDGVPQGRERGREGPSVPRQAERDGSGSGSGDGGLGSGAGGRSGAAGRSGGGQRGGGADGWDQGGVWGFGGPDRGAGGVPPLGGASLGELPGWRATYERDFLDPDYVDPAERRRVPAQRLPPEEEGGADQAAVKQAAAAPPRSRLRRLFGGPAPVVETVEEEQVVVLRRPLPLVESLAALVLAAAAVLGLWYVALLGWLLAYTARRIGRRAAHFAGLWLPLLAALACASWFYAHVHGQPAGHPLTDPQFKALLRSTVAFWLRAAAGCSTVFLAWRISRR